MRDEARTALAAALVRGAVVAVAVVTAMLGRPYDDSIAVATPPLAPAAAAAEAPGAGAVSWLDGLLLRAVVPLASWDGVFFQRIAEAGYEYEQFHAFFPLVPAVGRAVSIWVVQPICAAAGQPLSPRVSWAVAAVLVSNVSHVVACVLLLWLTERVLAVPAGRGTSGSSRAASKAAARRLAVTAATLFAITPAGVFASAAYTESLFAALTFGGLLLVERARSLVVEATAAERAGSWAGALGFASAGALVLAAATLARSNGATHAGYLGYWALEAAACVLGPVLLVPASVSKGETRWGAAVLWGRWLWGSGGDGEAEAGESDGRQHAPQSLRRRPARRAAEAAVAGAFEQGAVSPVSEADRRLASASLWSPSPVLASHASDWICPCLTADRRATDAAGWLFAPEAAGAAGAPGPLPVEAVERPTVAQRLAALSVAGVGLALAGVVALPLLAFALYGHALYCGWPAWLEAAVEALGGTTGHLPAAAAWVARELVDPPVRLMLGLASDGPIDWLPRQGSHPDRPWCGAAGGLGLYGFVQDEYWGVGAFRYWRLSQLPNFALAAPALAAATCGVLWYFHGRIGRTICGVGGLLAAAGGVAAPGALQWGTALPAGTPSMLARAAAASSARVSARATAWPVPWQAAAMTLSPRALPYVVHLGLLTVGALVGMHVQVVTRFLAACPALHWWLAALWLWPDHAERARYRWWVAAWLTGYTAIGTVLFPLFYPWT